MTLAVWLSACVVCALGAMSPGPSLAVVIRNTVSNGGREGVATAWAHAVGVGLYALATTFGLAALIIRY
ncbi:MAG TPA: LysE family transporter, partial [Pseudomonadales bacterium]|nr:LysE family transporter [Pseudomonadales bacterium]